MIMTTIDTGLTLHFFIRINLAVLQPLKTTHTDLTCGKHKPLVVKLGASLALLWGARPGIVFVRNATIS